MGAVTGRMRGRSTWTPLMRCRSGCCLWDALGRSAGGCARGGMDMPEDRHDVRGAFVGLDEEREKLDQRLSSYCRGAASRLAVVVLDAATADANSPFVHLPEPGYERGAGRLGASLTGAVPHGGGPPWSGLRPTRSRVWSPLCMGHPGGRIRAVHDGESIGIVSIIHDPRIIRGILVTWRVCGLGVLPAYRGLGIGKRLARRAGHVSDRVANDADLGLCPCRHIGMYQASAVSRAGASTTSEAPGLHVDVIFRPTSRGNS
jgi:GNAT superfamily N-acetyltransferase